MAAPTPAARLPFLSPNSENGDMGFYLEDYKGEAFAGSETATENIKRLPFNPCKYVLLANWNTVAASAQTYQALSGSGLYEDAGFELYYGFNGVLCCQLFPSQNSGLIPVNNTNQIVYKARPAATVQLWFAWFV